MMQIDDPGSALAALNDSEDRSEFLPHKTLIATGLSAAFGAVAAATTGADAILCTTAADFHNCWKHHRFSRRTETARVRFISTRRIPSQKRYAGDAGGKAEIQGRGLPRVTRGSSGSSVGSEIAERVRRIAHLLTAFIFSPNSPQMEEARVMLEIAGNLFDMDSFVLGRMRDEMHADIKRRQGHPELNDIVAAWRKLRNAHSEFREGTINSSCARLQSHGLVMRVEPGTGQFDLQTYVCSITDFGIRFHQWWLKDLNWSLL